jgi:hypothetical protein
VVEAVPCDVKPNDVHVSLAFGLVLTIVTLVVTSSTPGTIVTHVQLYGFLHPVKTVTNSINDKITFFILFSFFSLTIFCFTTQKLLTKLIG